MRGLNPENTSEVLEALDKRVEKRGSFTRFAEEHRLSYEHLRSMKSGARRINQKVASALGFKLMWIREDK